MAERKRLPPEQARIMALEAARILLIETGPQSVTLKAVAGRVGRTHANLLHHFGSAAGLQKALARYLAEMVCDAITQTVVQIRAEEGGGPRQVVDLTFDAFGKEGGGALAGWMLLSGNEDALDPIVESIQTLVDELHPEETGQSRDRREMHRTTLALVFMALGDALIGDQLAEPMGLHRDAAREAAEKMLVDSLLVTQSDCGASLTDTHVR
ncbi:MAG: TetR/AcrR family transcriptional regulator [Sphingomonadaceae bacterium]